MTSSMRLYEEGEILKDDEYLLKIRGSRHEGSIPTGFLTKFNKDGSIPKAFKEWGSYRYASVQDEILFTYVFQETYRSGWKLFSYRFGKSQNWAEMIHPEGFIVEIYLTDLLDLIHDNVIVNGQLIGRFKWEGNKLYKDPNEKKILYIDMDGVVADFDKCIKGIKPELYEAGEFDTYDKKSDEIDAIVSKQPTIFETLDPIEGSIEAVNKLFPLYDVYFLSTPMHAVPESFKGKRIWLEKHFGENAKKKLVLSHRKDLSIGSYLIDDRTKNGAGEFTGKHIHFGTAKFPNWDATYKYLKKKSL